VSCGVELWRHVVVALHVGSSVSLFGSTNLSLVGRTSGHIRIPYPTFMREWSSQCVLEAIRSFVLDGHAVKVPDGSGHGMLGKERTGHMT
jgi:hypothetical protein